LYLNCHTHYSFKYGTLSPHELLIAAKQNEVAKFVLTEVNNTASYIEVLRTREEELGESNPEIAVGIEFRRKDKLLYIAIARDNGGFQDLNRFLSEHHNGKIPFPARLPLTSDRIFTVYPWQSNIPPKQLDIHEFVGVRVTEINKVHASSFSRHIHKLVVLHPVTFKDRTGFNAHRLLRAIDQNVLLSKLSIEKQALPDEMMMPEKHLTHFYKNYPQIVHNTRKLIDNCQFHIEFHTNKNKATFTESRTKDREMLAYEATAGLALRYKSQKDEEGVRSRFQKELEVIAAKRFESYYLIAYDIVRFARHKNFDYMGRGSGANSIIAYCLGITNVDPIDLDLYFERFLNPERSSPPDFDIDFSWKDRDEVTRYIFERYGTENTALLGTHTTFKERSVIRELGKVFGLPKDEIDNLVRYPARNKNKDQITRMIFKYKQLLLRMPAHLSIHAGGILIAEAPIYAYTATDLPPKGFPTTHFEMHNAEDIGLYKLDILSQRGLGHIKDTIRLVKKNRDINVDATDFEMQKKDPAIKKMLSRGKTLGCFYVESPAMRMLLGKLACDDYRTLVAASSIIRPGVARSGMMRTYIQRHREVKNGGFYMSIHPKMDELMAETYGVMVYQEDVIKVAHHFAGLSLTESDVLRRGMSGKYRSRQEFQRIRQRFMENCHQRKYEKKIVDRVWYEIESFSGYSFSKGHSASYAVESYQSLYLKAHFPLEFMVGVINNFGGFYKTEFYFHEARMKGADLKPPCVNKSEYTTTIYGKTIYVGFIHIKNLETKLGQIIAQERKARGTYRSLENFVQRIPVELEQLSILIRIGAFRFTGKSKRELLWEAQLYFGKTRNINGTGNLFESALENYKLPPLEKKTNEDALDELELLGFPLCNPFDLLLPGCCEQMRAASLSKKINRQISIIGYLAAIKSTHTKDDKLMHFATFYDKDGHVFDTTHFPPVAKKYPFRGRGFYQLKGIPVEDFGYPMLEVTSMKKLPMLKDRSSQVRLSKWESY